MYATVPGVEVVLGSPLLINNVDTLALAAAPIQVLVSTKVVPNEGVGPATIAISKGSGKIKEVFSVVMLALQFPNGTEYKGCNLCIVLPDLEHIAHHADSTDKIVELSVNHAEAGISLKLGEVLLPSDCCCLVCRRRSRREA